MFRLESNMDSVFLNLRKSIVGADDDLEANLRAGALDATAFIADRVQQRGEGADGGRLQSKAPRSVGVYQSGYAKLRAARGRQTGHVDLTLTGDLFRAWQVLGSSPTQATVGFVNGEQAQRAADLEDYYGEPIFSLSNREQDQVADGIADRLIDQLQR